MQQPQGAGTPSATGTPGSAEGSQPTDLFKFDTLGGTQLTLPFQPKGIHDEMNSASFDEWGRMTANMGLEAPGATPLLQNIILYPYVNPATETLDATGMPSSLDVTPISSAADGTQLWKITHNGVDTHPIHFHLYDVQVINRVTWDNIIIPPDPTELGWKDTVRVSPLEDTIVAMRPIVPVLPFAVPDSKRPLNPMMPIGARGAANGVNGTEAGFNNTDANGNPIAPIVNEVTDFAWEYVVHCHILSHEEMDMMRPVTVEVPWRTPPAPTGFTFDPGSGLANWVDATPVDYSDPTTWHDPDPAISSNQEIGFRIERATVSGKDKGVFKEVTTGLANSTSVAFVPPDQSVTYDYRVTAFNTAGTASSSVVRILATTTVVTSNLNPSVFGQSVTLTARVQPNPGAGTNVEFFEGLTPLGSAPLDATGRALLPITNLTVGTHGITAKFPGAGTFGASTSPPFNQTVNPNSRTVVTTSGTPANAGATVTFTATINAVAPAVGTATGSVQFRIDGGNIGSPATITNGRATYSTNVLTVGQHTVSAVYSGDGNLTSSTSANITQRIR